MNLSSDQKAALYNEGIRRYNLLDEQIREIKSKSFEVSDIDMKKINEFLSLTNLQMILFAFK